MLDDLSTRVEHTDSKLRKVQRTMGDFIRRNEGEFLWILRVYRIRSAHNEGRNKKWMVYIDINHCSHDLTVTHHHHMSKRVAWHGVSCLPVGSWNYKLCCMVMHYGCK